MIFNLQEKTILLLKNAYTHVIIWQIFLKYSEYKLIN